MTDLTAAEKRQLRSLFLDPASFSRHILKHDTWPLQEEILRAVPKYPNVAVKACHNSSKTFLAGELVVWWLVRFRKGVVITTAPTGRSVKHQIWREVHKNLKTLLSRGIALPKANQVDIALDEDNFAIGFSTDEAVNFRGWKPGESGHMLLILDEANGIQAEIWEELEGIKAGGDVHTLVLGNPTESSGNFYDVFGKNAEKWKTFTISAFDVPNLKGCTPEDVVYREQEDPWLDENVRAYLATRRWVKDQFRTWGRSFESAGWQSRVMGQFPTHQVNAVIPLAWIEQCIRRNGQARFQDQWKKDPFSLGIDVARFGDDKSAFSLSKGPFCVGIDSYAKQSTMETAGRCVKFIRECEEKGLKIRSIKVDAGAMGPAVIDRVEELGYEVYEVNFGGRPYDSERFWDWRSEAWWHLRELCAEERVSLPDDPELIAQLSAPLYRFMSNGKIRLESKEDMKKRGVPSPDKGDALALDKYPDEWLSSVSVAVV